MNKQHIQYRNFGIIFGKDILFLVVFGLMDFV